MIYQYDPKRDGTLQACLDELADTITELQIPAGCYSERLVIRHSQLILRGIGQVTIEAAACVGRASGSGKPAAQLTTYQTATVYVLACKVTLLNLTIQNTAGPGHYAGQAVALYIDADQVSVINCRLIGHQDTVYLGQPKEWVPTRCNRNYFEGCRIVGTIDFIFGSAAALFTDCQLHSVAKEETGYITAAATPEDQEVGFVFYQCRVSSRYSDNRPYLGRPWRSFAKTSFIDCTIDCQLAEGLWSDWQKPEVRKTVTYGLLDCQLMEEQAAAAWIPSLVISKTQLLDYFVKRR